MASPTNLTDSISKLRECDNRFFQAAPHPPATEEDLRIRPRKSTTDYFTLFAYGLFTAVWIVQLALIVWLDIL